MTEIPDSLKERARRIIEMNDDSPLLLEMSIAEALHEAAQEATARERERAARVADDFTCGLCGMDGKAAAAIRQGA